MQVERPGRYSVEPLQPPLGEAPGALDAADLALVAGGLIAALADAAMPGVADMGRPVLAAPAVRVDGGVGRDPAAGSGP